MARKRGELIICDRCGTERFTENGHIPDDWMGLDYERCLCPACSIPFKRFMTWFFDKGQCPDEWRFKEGEDA